MMETIQLRVDAQRCIRCGRCAAVCPAAIFSLPAQGAARVSHLQSCIRCGHCADACPTGAVEHSLFPPQKMHPIDYAALPTPEQVELLCRVRRSNRAFRPEPVPDELLDRILAAAHLAPTASNLQQVSFTLVRDPELLRRIGDFTVGVFASAARKLENPLLRPLLRRLAPDLYRYLPSFKRMMALHDGGGDPILRGARAVILIHTPAASRFGCQDANLAYQNASLMAESLGVSHFYTGFVCTAVAQEGKGRLNAMLGIEGRIHAGMALGMPRFRFPAYAEREPISVRKM